MQTIFDKLLYKYLFKFWVYKNTDKPILRMRHNFSREICWQKRCPELAKKKTTDIENILRVFSEKSSKVTQSPIVAICTNIDSHATQQFRYDELERIETTKKMSRKTGSVWVKAPFRDFGGRVILQMKRRIKKKKRYSVGQSLSPSRFFLTANAEVSAWKWQKEVIVAALNMFPHKLAAWWFSSPIYLRRYLASMPRR